MANKPVVLVPGSHTAVGPNLFVSRIHWSEAVPGTAIVRDGAGNTIATLTYLGRGKGPEPTQINFVPPVGVAGNAVHASAPGGFLSVYLQGASESGH